jgi:hypothetical protein
MANPFFQVRGTPGSGKTTLMRLLHAQILAHDPGAIVEIIEGWRKEPGIEIGSEDLLVKRMKTYPFNSPHNNYLLFENAQETYWDGYLWDTLFKDGVQRGFPPFTILFCSYGNPGLRPVDYDNGTQLVLSSLARASLNPRNRYIYPRYPPIGLLFSREEFDDAVDRFKTPDRNSIFVNQELRQTLFEWTMGHAGAIADLLSMLCQRVSSTFHDY